MFYKDSLYGRRKTLLAWQQINGDNTDYFLLPFKDVMDSWYLMSTRIRKILHICTSYEFLKLGLETAKNCVT